MLAGGQRVAGQFFLPNGVALAVQGRLYVADTSNHRIQKLAGAASR